MKSVSDSKRKYCFIELYMPGNIYFVGRRMKTAVPFVM
jgi:hypothetical protein